MSNGTAPSITQPVTRRTYVLIPPPNAPKLMLIEYRYSSAGTNKQINKIC